MAARPPEIKFCFKFHDPKVYSSELIHAKINLTVTNAENYGIFFKDSFTLDPKNIKKLERIHSMLTSFTQTTDTILQTFSKD